MNQVSMLAVGKLRRVSSEFSKYFLVSLIALACDFSLLLVLSQYIHYAFSAVISFLIGAVIHYALSVLFVFSYRKLQSRKVVEWAIFVGTGAAGLLVNVGVIGLCVELFLMSLPLAKIVAAGFSFLFGYLVRKLVLF